MMNSILDDQSLPDRKELDGILFVPMLIPDDEKHDQTAEN